MSKDDKNRVGYKNPPKHTRFQKGQSGNPKGRPKASSADLDELINKHFYAKEKVFINGKEVDTTGLELLIMKLKEGSMKGNTAALRQLIALLNLQVKRRTEGPKAIKVEWV